MKKIFEILSAHKYAIIWSILYTATMWIILRAMFNFDMFSLIQWRYLMRAELRGFPGFVFGILLLAALPLYVATTTLIIRTKKPLFSIPVPTIIKKIYTRMQPTLINPKPEQANDTPEKTPEPEPASEKLPDELPSELRTAYIRARMHITPDQRSAFNQPVLPTPTDTIPAPTPEIDEIPLPTDFDIEPETKSDDPMESFLSMGTPPTFTSLDFDTPETEDTLNPITEYLNKIGTEFERINDNIITNKHVIASHTDPDFWVCEGDTWFATGKQRPSPIQEIKQIAAEKNLIPILYLGTTNIMEFDAFCTTCKSDGIIVITNPDEIPD